MDSLFALRAAWGWNKPNAPPAVSESPRGIVGWADGLVGRTMAGKLKPETQQPVSGICYEAGYFNLSNFNKNFLKRRGMTPSRYRDLALRKCPPGYGPCSKEAT